MPSDTVVKIKERLDIAGVVGSYISLERAGSNYKAKCPFHNERTPSFFVSPERGSFYCFGCQAKGDIFTFVEEFEGLDFKGALKLLAARAGVPLIYEKPEKTNEREKIYDALEETAAYFEKELAKQTEVLRYVSSRGVGALTIENFRLGFAPAGWRNLSEHLSKKGFSADILERAGLVKKGPKGFYDRFRSRVMFPIFDSASRAIGFSGRIWGEAGEEEAKYLNSPETELFNKSKILYGFDKAKLSIKKNNFAIFVEGQMDLVMSHQIGFTNTVATSGTALAENHLMLVGRLSNRIIFAFDPDKAGFKAAIRGARAALSIGMEVKIAPFPKAKDPADLAKEDPELFKKIIGDSLPVVDYILEKIVKAELTGRRLADAITTHLLPFVKAVKSRIEQSQAVKKISERTGIGESAIFEELKKVEIESIGEQTQNEKNPKESRRDFLERRIFGLILKEEISGGGGLLKDKVKSLLGEADFSTRKQEYEKVKDELLFEIDAHFPNVSDTSGVDDLLQEYQRDILKIQFGFVMRELALAEKGNDKAKAEAFLKKCQELSKQITELTR